MNDYSFLFVIGIVVIIVFLIDINRLLRRKEVDIYQTHLFGITKDGDIHPIIALGTEPITTFKHPFRQFAVHVRHEIDENGKFIKPEIWTWPIEYYKAILGHEPTHEEYVKIYGEDYDFENDEEVQ